MNSTDQRPSPRPAVDKVVIERAGSYDRLEMVTVAAFEPGDDEVVVTVHAIGVNYADCMVRMGLYQSAKDLVGWPITPGFEVAGVVCAHGKDVTDLPVGTRVIAMTLFDGYASEVCVRRPYIFAMPDGLSFSQAAGFTAVFLTAYYALHELAHPRPGATMLVHSAAGGVGTCLVQLGKRAGCQVVGVVGAAHKVGLARSMGADHVIDKSTEDLWAEARRLVPGGYDVVLDANGVATLKQSYRHLRRTGKLVVYGFHTMMPRRGGVPNWPKLITSYLRTPRFNPLEMTTRSRSVLAFNLSYLYERLDILDEAMTALLGWLESGQIQAPPVTEYAFARVADAHRDIESAQTTGKLVLIPDRSVQDADQP